MSLRDGARSPDDLRRECRQRSAAVGSLSAMAGLLRSAVELAGESLALIAELAIELELLDARLRLVHGQRWTDDLYEALRRGEVDDRDERA